MLAPNPKFRPNIFEVANMIKDYNKVKSYNLNVRIFNRMNYFIDLYSSKFIM